MEGKYRAIFNTICDREDYVAILYWDKYVICHKRGIGLVIEKVPPIHSLITILSKSDDNSEMSVEKYAIYNREKINRTEEVLKRERKFNKELREQNEEIYKWNEELFKENERLKAKPSWWHF